MSTVIVIIASQTDGPDPTERTADPMHAFVQRLMVHAQEGKVIYGEMM